MEPSSSFAQHHDVFDVFLQRVSFKKKEAKHHVQESSGKEDRRRTCGVVETDMLGIKKLERKATIHLGCGCFIRPRESSVGSEFYFRKHWETSAG